MGRVLEENLGLIRAHIRKGHGLKVFIPVMIVGNSMTIINWDSYGNKFSRPLIGEVPCRRVRVRS
jgi:hypothetical protein